MATRATAHPADCPAIVEEYAKQAVEAVRRALAFDLEWDSETLPVLDHYLGTVGKADPAVIELVAAAAGAYFGEVVRRRLGGWWDTSDEDPNHWRLNLATGLSFSPPGIVAAAIAVAEVDDLDSALDATPDVLPVLEGALSRMEDQAEDVYYSLCGRYDTLEHLQAVLLASEQLKEEERRRRAN